MTPQGLHLGHGVTEDATRDHGSDEMHTYRAYTGAREEMECKTAPSSLRTEACGGLPPPRESLGLGCG